MFKNRIAGQPFELLLIEDDDDHAELVRRGFKNNRMANNIFRVEDGEEALDYLFERGKFADLEEQIIPDVILLDLRLPKVDGLEVLRQIKINDRLQSIPVIILTTSDKDKDIESAYNLKANSYIVKPVDFTKFHELMDDIGSYWFGWNQFPWRNHRSEQKDKNAVPSRSGRK